MGQQLSEEELSRIEDACDMALALSGAKLRIYEYVESRMSFIAPNLSLILGASTAAKIMGETPQNLPWDPQNPPPKTLPGTPKNNPQTLPLRDPKNHPKTHPPSPSSPPTSPSSSGPPRSWARPPKPALGSPKTTPPPKPAP
ncbi:extensin-like [Corapipo altera]|uniref:extensin-like n=1 Tax=Corapipo altera TaxID=415028 RepID=UPI000FD6A047|nr:extensin-like [Corapipo altera]